MTALSLSGCVETLGRNIPQDDLVGDYLRALVWAVALSLPIAFAPVARGHKQLLVRYWAIKSAVALGAMLFYEYWYGLDAYHYFASAQGPFVWEGLEFGRGTSNMIHLAWIHDHIVPNSYHAMKVTCAHIGLWAVYIFYRSGVLFLEHESPRLFWLLGLYPSVIFWSSILGKDPIVLLGISLYTYGVLLWARRGSLIGLGIAILGILIAVLIRTWLGPILLAPTAVFILFRARSVPLKVLLGTAAIAGFLYASGGLLEKFSVETSEDLFLTANSISRGWARGGSGQTLSTEFTSIGTMIQFMPLGISAALFRPFPFEVLSPFGLLAGFENAFLIFLLVRACRRTRFRELNQPLIAWMLLTIGTWATVYGFVSYQNLGSAVRFRLQVLPLLLILLLHLARWPLAAKAEGRTQIRAAPRALRTLSRNALRSRPQTTVR